MNLKIVSVFLKNHKNNKKKNEILKSEKRKNTVEGRDLPKMGGEENQESICPMEAASIQPGARLVNIHRPERGNRDSLPAC